MKWFILLLTACCVQPPVKPDDTNSDQMKQVIADAQSDMAEIVVRLNQICVVGCLKAGHDGGFLDDLETCMCYKKAVPDKGYKIQWL